jgi:polyhydroxyalkanoate synthase
LIDKYVTFYDRMDDKGYVDNFMKMERWIFDSPDVPGESYRQFIRDLYQRNMLVRNALVIDGSRVDLRNITVPLLSVVAEQDNLVPPGSSIPLGELVSSKSKKLMTYPGGHIGLSVSLSAHREFWPRVADWIVENSKPGREEGGGTEGSEVEQSVGDRKSEIETGRRSRRDKKRPKRSGKTSSR